MAKTKVQQWDTTADNNTDINSINIDENCPAANVNNAQRETMAQIATALSGNDDSIITGTAGVSGNLATWNADGDIVDGGSQLGMIPLETISFSNDATGDFTAFNNTLYRSYLFVAENLIPATDAVALRMQLSSDGGTSFIAGATDYGFAYNTLNFDATTSSADAGGRDTSIRLVQDVGSDSGEYGASGQVMVWGAGNAAFTYVKYDMAYKPSTTFHQILRGGGGLLSDVAVDAARFFFRTSGGATVNTESGTITMYGLRAFV